MAPDLGLADEVTDAAPGLVSVELDALQQLSILVLSPDVLRLSVPLRGFLAEGGCGFDGLGLD